MNKKGYVEFSLWLIVLIFTIGLLIGAFVGFRIDEARSLERNEVEYECPILFEQGNYLFVDGTLISPSLKRLKCIEIGEKENE